MPSPLHLGYGRRERRPGRYGNGLQRLLIRTSDAPLFATGATIKKTGDSWEIAVTKSHYSDDRGPARWPALRRLAI